MCQINIGNCIGHLELSKYVCSEGAILHLTENATKTSAAELRKVYHAE